jgi:hypothetical protein
VVHNFAQQYSYNGIGISGVSVYTFLLIIFHIVYSSVKSDPEEQISEKIIVLTILHSFIEIPTRLIKWQNMPKKMSQY